MPRLIGTAGHIDHGKTALVKALTGVDADRLPDEKRRGITIDLGFAGMTMGSSHFDFVDVPGHERFVRNMLAGASGIDIVMLVVAADEGVMPQTREHFDICRLFDIKAGIVVLNKSDLVDDETLDLARLDVAELVAGSFLDDAPVIAVSARTGEGIEELKAGIAAIAGSLQERDDLSSLRLPIDRSFSVKGFGTVVTGTLASGNLTVERPVVLMPEGRPVRIRGLQAHGSTTEVATAGQRVAVNLAGLDHDQVSRGMTLAESGTLKPNQVIDAKVELLASSPSELRSRQRVRIHLGTAEILGRIQVLNDQTTNLSPGETDLLQLRLETAAVAVPGQRFIIRSYSPQVTIAGGVVIDNSAVRHRRKDLVDVRNKLLARLEVLSDPDRSLSLIVEHAGRNGILRSDLRAASALAGNVFEDALSRALASGHIADADGIFVAHEYLQQMQKALADHLARFHKQMPLEPGITREALLSASLPYVEGTVGAAVIKRLRDNRTIAVENDLIRLATHSTQMTPEEAAFTDKLLATLEQAGLGVPRIAEAVDASRRTLPPDRANKLLHMLASSGRIVKVSDEFYFARSAIDRTIDLIRTRGGEAIDVAAFKALTGVSRKYAIPLLEYFDRTHVTARVGDKRVIIR